MIMVGKKMHESREEIVGFMMTLTGRKVHDDRREEIVVIMMIVLYCFIQPEHWIALKSPRT